MSYTPSASNVMFGRGSIYIDRFDANGAVTGYVHMGNCDTLAISISTDKVDMTDYTQETSSPYKEVTKKTTVGLKISGFEFATQQLAMATMGDTTTYTQTSHTVTAETIAASTLTALLGRYFRTLYRNISAVTVKQGVTTLVAGTDYEIADASSGLIRILPTSTTVATGTAITVDYTAAAITTGLNVVRGGTKALVEGKLLFIPDNTTGPNNELHIWRVSLTPDGDLGLIADDFAKWNLSGTIVSDAAGTYGGSTSNPYYELVER